MILLPWRAPRDVYGQIVKLSWEKGSPLGLHTHEYPEIFWLDEGPCRHRINGTEELLQPGELVFIRASDRHQLIAAPGHRFTMTNLECQPALISALMGRHRTTYAVWFDKKRPLPCKISLSASQLKRLQQLIADLTARQPDLLSIEGFLLDLARLITPSQSPIAGISGCPDWLQDALLKAQFPDVFTRGPAGLFRAARRSPEHVSRLCRKLLNLSPTDIIEKFRMADAEQKLRLTALSVTEIALSCGYSTTAQFHRAFKKTYQNTPHRYRRWIRGT